MLRHQTITAVSPRASVRLALLSTSIALLLAACATPVSEPKIDVPEKFATVPAAQTAPEAAWWESFGDPVLSDLIQRAERENRDVKIAAERVIAARAGTSISRSWLLPSVSLVGSGSDQRTGYGAPIKDKMPDTKSIGGGAEVSWELDLSGRLRAGAAAAAADARAAEHNMRGVRLLVMTDVASNYFMFMGALRQLETVRAISAAQDETLRLVSARQRVGLATPFDVERSEADASSAHAAIPPLETLAAVSRHRIAVLVGDQAFNAASIAPWLGDVAVPVAQPGQPADLLLRRPDLLAAKAQLDAANARRRAAAAEWFPHIFLDAVFGRGSTDINGVALGAARFTNATALLAMPLFNAGRTQSINDIAKSGQTEAVLRYEDAIVRALEDVENALASLGNERDRASALQSAARSADSAYGRAQSMYRRGQIDLLPLLDAQRTQLSIRMNATDSNTQLLLDSVQLYKALGGGWQIFQPTPETPVANATHAPTT